MEYDIQKITEQARREQARVVGELVSKAAHWIFAEVKNVFTAIRRFDDAMFDAVSARERDAYFANSTSLADLELRQRRWEQNRYQFRF